VGRGRSDVDADRPATVPARGPTKHGHSQHFRKIEHRHGSAKNRTAPAAAIQNTGTGTGRPTEICQKHMTGTVFYPAVTAIETIAAEDGLAARQPAATDAAA
jgi:hypothetical protein